MRYTVIVETTPNNCSAYVPDLPGCVSTGDTLEELKANMAEAITLHLEGMIEDEEPIPNPSGNLERAPDHFEVEITAQHV